MILFCENDKRTPGVFKVFLCHAEHLILPVTKDRLFSLYKRIGYNINIIRQSVRLVFNPITVNNFASLFNCTPVGRASDSVMAPTSSYLF